MLKAVEAIIEPDGTIRTLEPLRVEVATRAIVTLLAPVAVDETANGARVLALLQSSRFADRPMADPVEVAQRIDNLRNDWD